MKATAVGFVVLLATAIVSAQQDIIPLDKVVRSQRGTVSQKIANTEITIEYGRPVARGRALFGALVVVLLLMAVLIPFFVVFRFRKFSPLMSPIIVYLIIGLLLNFAQNFIFLYSIKFPFTSEPGENNFVYNTHSILRLIIFSWF